MSRKSPKKPTAAPANEHRAEPKRPATPAQSAAPAPLARPVANATAPMSRATATQPTTRPAAQTTPKEKKPIQPVSPLVWWIALGLLMLVQFLFRSHVVPMPLERDEGEYAYMGQLLLQGVPPFKEAANMKLPGTSMIYALFMGVFGQSAWGIHAGLLLMTLGSMALLFLAFRRLYSPLVGVLAAGAYSFMCIGVPVLGFAAHATHFVVFFVAAGLLALARYQDGLKTVSALVAGLLFGLSFLMKQQAVFFPIFGGLFVLITLFFQKKMTVVSVLRDAGLYSVGVLTPYLLLVLWMVMSGNFEQFWFWTVQYASKYAAGAPEAERSLLFGYGFNPLYAAYTLFWWLGLAGLVAVWFGNYSTAQKTAAVLFIVLSALAVVPGFYFRQHYFVVFLPALALGFGLTLDVAVQRLTAATRLSFWAYIPLALLAFVGLRFYSANKPYLSQVPPTELARQIYGGNPFAESPVIADYIKQRTTETDKIAVLGSEPQLFLYTGRRSATRHIYTYGLMEEQPYNLKMQEEMIADIEKAKPKFVVFCRVPFSWLQRPKSPTRIFEWSNEYLQKGYDLVGAADIKPEGTQFVWDEAAKGFNSQNQNVVLVFRRKAA